jgi:hypothetical protein
LSCFSALGLLWAFWPLGHCLGQSLRELMQLCLEWWVSYVPMLCLGSTLVMVPGSPSEGCGREGQRGREIECAHPWERSHWWPLECFRGTRRPVTLPLQSRRSLTSRQQNSASPGRSLGVEGVVSFGATDKSLVGGSGWSTGALGIEARKQNGGNRKIPLEGGAGRCHWRRVHFQGDTWSWVGTT